MVSRETHLRFTLLGILIGGVAAIGYGMLAHQTGFLLLGGVAIIGGSVVLWRGEQFIAPMMFGIAGVACLVALGTAFESGVSVMLVVLTVLVGVSAYRGLSYWRAVNTD